MKTLLTVKNLKTHFFLDEGIVRAVDGVDLEIAKARTVGLVGESGCGKSVTAFSILRLVSHPGRIVSGSIIFHGANGTVDIGGMDDECAAIRNIRGREIAMIFQEPMTSLSPVYTVGNQIREAILLHTNLNKKDARARAVKTLEHVGVPDPDRRYGQYPHAMSGGLRQRAMIAMALSCRPSLLIADEPTTALDVTIQAQILQLMRDLQDETDMSILLITHDWGVIAEMADEVAVMYLGRIVEQTDVMKIFDEPLHPYTRALLKSMPGSATTRKSKIKVIRGSVPDPFERIPGCPFHPRCEEAEKGLCDQGNPPELFATKDDSHKVACFVRHREFENERK